jgi:hypothetical protein
MRRARTAHSILDDTAAIAVVSIPIASIIAALVTFIGSIIWGAEEELLVFGITWCAVTVFAQLIMRKLIMRIIVQITSRDW